MEREYIKNKNEQKKENVAGNKIENPKDLPKQEAQNVEKKEEDTKTEIKEEVKTEEKKGKEKKKQERKIREQAVVNGKDLGISKKQSMDICRFIKGKRVEQAIKELEEVVKMKRALPMRGEIPHRHGMMSGRYPKTACGVFIMLLKSLQSNASEGGIMTPQIIMAKANKASRPFRRFGSRKFKRTHVSLIAKEYIVKDTNLSLSSRGHTEKLSKSSAIRAKN
ncbi:hypothetical protein HYW76_03625 [Candidatus Pacearchaeota archaeon]|nr:hypothetical protein [Candidatus Pacearchaeota archaeon]